MSLKKGFLRLTIVLSILAGIGFLLYVTTYVTTIENIDDPLFVIPLLFAMGFVPVWLVYFFIEYIVVGYILKGFKKE
ncbi:hypothetical protein ES695_11365 [Candidatus Atribacteria bacterium 1244-E10-H5-B2]|nr:MAG: hypothetical protein ES695_11365 [Candidatus Atribacteria bacterium 1244-E10-H5-B2]